MLDSKAIFRLYLEEDEAPGPEVPVDPDDFDAKSEVNRYAETPFSVPGAGPTDLYSTLLHRLHGRPQKKTATATYITRNSERDIAVRYHSTDVITAYADGRVVTATGGWMTRTTNARINEFLPSGWKIYQKQGVWYWWNTVTRAGTTNDERIYPYTDGDSILPSGALQCQTPPIYFDTAGKKRPVTN